MDNKQPQSWRTPRHIVKRIVIKGDLVLQSGAHFGAGDPDPLSYVDMMLLKDPLEGKALLPGASIAGALRNYLRERELGFSHKITSASKERQLLATALFGAYKGDDDGKQSLLIVNDALAEVKQIELRDGVRIDPATRTAQEDMLFSLEILPAGTIFPLSFELLALDKDTDKILKGLVIALQGFEQGAITLGAKKRRGYGQCKVESWQVTEYNLTDPSGLIAWLNQDTNTQKTAKTVADALNFPVEKLDKRAYFELKSTFGLDGSLLIRSHVGSREGSPDTAHIHTIDINGKRLPFVPGASLAGVIRHRALRIAKTIFKDETEKADDLVDEMFGCEKTVEKVENGQTKKEQVLKASRVIVEDAPLKHVKPMVQNRVKLDRFTGGAFKTALINQEPIFGHKDRSELGLNLRLRTPQAHEIGLLLLVLKDLWTGDLPLGGESSIGRGRLQGKKADLLLSNGNGKPKISWHISQTDQGLEVSNRAELNYYIEKLWGGQS